MTSLSLRACVTKSIWIVRLKFAQHVPDSGQKHFVNSNDSLFMSMVAFDSVIPLFKFRVFFEFAKCIGNLNKKRFQITISRGNVSGLYFTVASGGYVDTASLGNKMFG